MKINLKTKLILIYKMLNNGWEFYILNPFDENIKQTTQDKYNDMYNKAYECLLGQLCIPSPNDLLCAENTTFIYYINCSDENDNIELEETYDYTFRKSVFFDKKFKKIKSDIDNYYKLHNIKVSNIYKEDSNYFIVLETK
tara:strand:- start:8553 stop:8972 length:420 start_codon:yes stop_codon:yes gene_type:complete